MYFLNHRAHWLLVPGRCGAENIARERGSSIRLEPEAELKSARYLTPEACQRTWRGSSSCNLLRLKNSSWQPLFPKGDGRPDNAGGKPPSMQYRAPFQLDEEIR